MRWAAVPVAVLALTGCGSDPGQEADRGPAAQIDVLSAEVTAIEVESQGRTIPCVLAKIDGGYGDGVSVSCDWTAR